MNEIKHTPGKIWLQRAKELAQSRADASFAYGALPSDADHHESTEAYERSLAADRALDAHFAEASALIDDLIHAVEAVAEVDDDARHMFGKPLLISGIRFSIDAALIKAGRKEAPAPVRHFTIAGVRDE